MLDRLAGDEAGELGSRDRLELVQHPEHVLGGGHDVRRRDIGLGTDVARHLPHPPAADLLLLPLAQVVRITDHAALGAAEGDVHHGALPGHPHGQRANGVERLLGVEANAALARAAGIVVLHAEAAEDL